MINRVRHRPAPAGEPFSVIPGQLRATVHSGRRAVDFHLRDGFSHHRQFLLWEPAAP